MNGIDEKVILSFFLQVERVRGQEYTQRGQSVQPALSEASTELKVASCNQFEEVTTNKWRIELSVFPLVGQTVSLMCYSEMIEPHLKAA